MANFIVCIGEKKTHDLLISQRKNRENDQQESR